jgi:hypothetical protein
MVAGPARFLAGKRHGAGSTPGSYSHDDAGVVCVKLRGIPAHARGG